MSSNNYFYAMLHRMRYIKRWSLMRNSEEENVQEHTLEVAYIAHALALISPKVSPGEVFADPKTCVMLALYHDVSEMITGDLPTPIKYYNQKIYDSFLELEEEALQLMVETVPEALREEYAKYLSPQSQDPSFLKCQKIVKAADTLSAYIKCLDEKAAGNKDFEDAEKTILQKLHAYQMPEVEWFLDTCIEAYSLTLDELREQDRG